MAGTAAGLRYTDLLKAGDEHLMQELQAGNADAFAMVFDGYHRLIFVTALRILHDAGEAEDLTQTIFL
jgi:DNA-directed RNA polymerase specialized sigma24 family protein